MDKISEIHEDQFGAHLQSQNPYLWGAILTEELEKAAVWSWSLRKVKDLVFWGEPFGHIPAYVNARAVNFPTDDPWEGLPPDRLLIEMEAWTFGNVPIGHDGDMFALHLNLSIAAWAGREFEPSGVLESRTYSRLLVFQAACEGDIDKMRDAVKRYGMDSARNHGPAFETAASRRDLEFARALIREVGPNVALDTMNSACCLKEDSPAGLRDAVAFAFEAGIVCPAWALDTIRLWAKTDPRFTVILL